MSTPDHEPRIAVYLDYENLAIGARDNLRRSFDFAEVADALAERGRVIVRKAYADWSYFDEDRRMLTRHQVELIDIPQKMGGSRKNAADIKMAIDAIELALDREYISTFVICTGDSDLSPLVQKLRELDRTVIGVGIKGSTSKLLPPACDEFLFYDNLVSGTDDTGTDEPTGAGATGSGLDIVVTTLAGLEASSGSGVRASTLKRAVLRKDPTFNEADHGFRGFAALLASLADEGSVALEGTGDPHVSLSGASASDTADSLLVEVVTAAGEIPLTGVKTAMKKQDPDFSERRIGYRNFSGFIRAAEAKGLVRIEGEDDDRVVKVATKRSRSRRR